MENITITALVATNPRHIITSEGLAITSFRAASNQRAFNEEKQEWEDAHTNWYTVTAFRQLALNSVEALNKGDRVIVAGNLRIREWDSGDRTGTSVEIIADSIGHDLRWGTTTYTRVIPAEKETPNDPEEIS